MTTYTDAFGGANIYPADISYSEVTLTADTTFAWPEETNTSSNLVTRIIDIVGLAAYALTMPDAREVSPGETVLFNNVGAETQIIKDNSGTQIVALEAGTAWQIYLTDNSTAAGTWGVFQYGAGVSQANASALAGNGLVAIGSLLAQSMPVSSFNSDYTAGSTDRAKLYVWSGAGGTLTLDSSTLSADWFMYLRNSGSGNIVVDPAGGGTIDGASTLSFQPNESAILATDGANYFTIGFGQSATFAFDYTSIPVPGAGTYTLSGSELNRIVYKFTGILTANREIVVPATVQQYWVDNSTTGAFSLTIKTAATAGVPIASGQRAILYCDGTDVVDADTSTVSLPITVAQGGTGAVNASSARVNLGATALGDTIFTAPSTATVWSALGVAPAGTVNGGAF